MPVSKTSEIASCSSNVGAGRWIGSVASAATAHLVTGARVRDADLERAPEHVE